VPCGEIIVVDADGRELPPGESGELWIRGPMVVPGYWDNPEATRQSFTDGYWRSGDLGSVDRNGFVRVFDRLKDMINRGGYKVYSVEVENVLSHHPAVLESAVVGKPCPVLGERVHAFVTLKQLASADELKRYCAERLADYKVPETFTLLDRPLPRNANGKLLKRELREAVPGA
jgi:O-succinylbenzoic acid--CoA ligase